MLTNVVFLWNPGESFYARAIPRVEAAARALGIEITWSRHVQYVG
jgi:hypothetical protein